MYCLYKLFAYVAENHNTVVELRTMAITYFIYILLKLFVVLCSFATVYR